MEQFLVAELQIVVLLLVVALVAVVARRVRLPYTVALVLVGLGLTFQSRFDGIEMTPELVLAILLPPLVFEAAFHLQFRELRADLGPILALAVPGVVLGTALVGAFLVATDTLPLPLALLFGALISATDPVSVIATFKEVGAPRRLSTLMEAESLFNDGTAIVAFTIVLGLVRAGALDPVQGAVDFLRVALGGLAVGLGLGYTLSFFIDGIDDYLIETTLTTVLAYGSFLLAEHFLHVSGVLAVVAAGLVNGNVSARGMSPTTRIVLFNFWEYVAFLANSLVFLLIGMSVEWDILLRYLPSVGAAIVAVLATRALTVYGLGALIKRVEPDLPAAYFHVMVWGGLRGAVSLALALSLPFSLGAANRQQLLAMTFGVVLFSMLAQATTIPWLLRRLGFTPQRFSTAYERLQGRLLAVRAARRHVDQLHDAGALLPHPWQHVSEELNGRERELLTDMDELLRAHPELHNELLTLARSESLRAQRAALTTLANERLFSMDAISTLQAEVDEALQAPTRAYAPDREAG